MIQKLFSSANVMEKNPVFFNDRDVEVLKRTPGFELLSEVGLVDSNFTTTLVMILFF